MNFLSIKRIGFVFLVSLVTAGAVLANDTALRNWKVPVSGTGEITKMGDLTQGIAFVGVDPCRIVDTRGPTGAYGAPALAAGVNRNFDLNDGPCTGIPPGVDAYSLNITVTNTAGPGFILIYPQGGTQPVVSTLNYIAGQTVANAAIVPAGTGGGVTVVAGVSGADLIIDINGYFSDQFNPDNYFSVVSSCGTCLGVIFGQNTNTTGQRFGGHFIADSSGADSAGVRALASASTGVTHGVRGENNSTSALAIGVLGRINSTAPGGSSAGVRGINNGTAGSGIGVWGSQAGSGWGVLGTAVSGLGVYGSSTSGFGVYGDTATTDNGEAAVYGTAFGTTGRVHGVLGISSSATAGAAGVKGVDSSGEPSGSTNQTAGVLGLSDLHIGVEGVSENAGVRGEIYNSAGVFQALGILGLNSGVFYGVWSTGNYGGSGAKYFVEPHPEKADMVIRYVALEGPESGTYFRGRGKFQRGLATIEVPEDFRLVTDSEGLSIQVTPIGEMATVAVMNIGLDRIVVKGSRNVEFFYTVNGVRRSHRHLTPMGQGREFMPEAADAKMSAAYTEVQKQMLISNGTYKEDGSVNMETAKALGWDKIWEERTTGKKTESSAKAGQQTQE